jgi:hypothetical protein
MSEASSLTEQSFPNDNTKRYQLLLHALSHPDNLDNIDRHALLLQKWTRDFSDGLLVRDLGYANQIIGILRERLMHNYRLFYPVFQAVMTLCAKVRIDAIPCLTHQAYEPNSAFACSHS